MATHLLKYIQEGKPKNYALPRSLEAPVVTDRANCGARKGSKTKDGVDGSTPGATNGAGEGLRAVGNEIGKLLRWRRGRTIMRLAVKEGRWKKKQ